MDLISNILSSHGYGQSNLPNDPMYWGRIQRSLEIWDKSLNSTIKGRDAKDRKSGFFVEADIPHKKLECLKDLYYQKKRQVYQTFMRYNIPHSSYYKLIKEYCDFGPWSVVSAPSLGKHESIYGAIQLKVILDKLEHPSWSPQQIIDHNKFKCSRFAVNRVIRRWGIEDKARTPVALDRLVKQSLSADD